MKKWKTWQIAMFVIFCILINFAGSAAAERFNLFLWLDSFGTVLCAYCGGPFCGAVVGAAGNIMMGQIDHTSYIYALVSIALGIVIGIFARRKAFNTMYGTMKACTFAALATVAITVPLNLFIHPGGTGNMWGDGVVEFLLDQKVPEIVCVVVGQFYMEFVDKLFILLVLYLCIRILRKMKERRGNQLPPGETDMKEVLPVLVIFLFAACISRPAAAQELSVNADQAAAQELSADTGQGSARENSGDTDPVSAQEQSTDTDPAAPGVLSAGDYNDYVQTVYSSSNGLPCGEANTIAQTNDGILWIGTYAGLYRYNGHEFRWMDKYDSVRNVNCLYVDAEGRMWIGTNDNGLSIAINEEIVNVLDQERGMPSNSVRSITQSADGYYYIGTTQGMLILALNGGLKRVNTLREVNYADCVAADKRGNVAAVTADGRLFLINRGQIRSSLRLVNEDADIFNCCGFDQYGRLLAGTTGNRIHIYDITRDCFIEKKTLICEGLKNLNSFYMMENGEIILSADNGIGYLNRKKVFHRINTNDFNNSIDSGLLDYQGNFWFVSSRLGVLRLAHSAFRDIFGTAGIDPQVVNAVVEWQDDYYIGTDRGLVVVDSTCREQVTNEYTEKLEGVRIRCLMSDKEEHLWVCTYGKGLYEFCPDGTEYLYNMENGSFGNRVRTVLQLSDGRILAGGDTGLCFIKDHKILQEVGNSDKQLGSMVLTMIELSDGRILAGTDGDGIAVIEDGAITGILTRKENLSSEVILRMIPDTKSSGIFIVSGNGLCYMEEDGTIRQLSHFPYFNNYDIWAKDENTLFVLGSSGIYVVDRDDLVEDRENYSYDLLDARRGLNSALTANSWNYSDSSGRLFLPCDKGVFIMDTGLYSSEIRAYRMMVTSASLDGKSQKVERGMPLNIDKDIGKVELFPEIINYTIQDPYAGYYLEGFDSGWTIQPQSTMTSISYTNLPSGEYKFHLAVFDNSKEKILEERIYTLVKEKEIYENRWFMIYLLLVGMFIVVWITVLFFRTQVQRTLELQKRELDLARKQTQIANDQAEMARKQTEIANKQVEMANKTIMTIAYAVDARDVRTSEHSRRVSEYSVLLARAMGFSEEECENLRKAARMHDIGKIGIPDSILNKPARLTDEEYAEMKTHVTRGAEILKDITVIEHVVDGARYHHERYDGRGYPDGLKGEEIPLYGRIIGVADAFDAMTANRVYRKQMDFGYVLEEMRKGRGTQFDPEIVDLFLSLIDNGTIDLESLYGSGNVKSGGDS